jgi:hypothetical protein
MATRDSLVSGRWPPAPERRKQRVATRCGGAGLRRTSRARKPARLLTWSSRAGSAGQAFDPKQAGRRATPPERPTSLTLSGFAHEPNHGRQAQSPGFAPRPRLRARPGRHGVAARCARTNGPSRGRGALGRPGRRATHGGPAAFLTRGSDGAPPGCPSLGGLCPPSPMSLCGPAGGP